MSANATRIQTQEKYNYTSFLFCLFQFKLVIFILILKEELETVFDKGVDATNNSEIVYLNELTKTTSELFDKLKNSSEIRESMEKTFRLLENRLIQELTLFETSLKQMKYNDIKMTKVVTHLMFLRLFDKRIENNNTNKLITFIRKTSDLNVNFYLRNYLK